MTVPTLIEIEKPDGVTLIEIERSQGPRGLAGPEGPAGPTGPTGPAFNLLPEVANAAALPASDNTIGDARFTADDDHLRIWTGTAWEDRGAVTAPSGPLPLYTITGYSATLPTGETAVANYADIAAFEAAVIPTYSGQRCQVVGWDGAPDAYNVLEARWNGTTFEWGPA